MHNPDNSVRVPPPTPSTPPIPPPPSPPVPVPEPRRSYRVKKAPVRYGTVAQAACDSSSSTMDLPKRWKQVLCSPNKDKWIKAADAEFANLLGMKTWKLVPRPSKRKFIKSKWVFKPKLRLDGSILKLKVRLVAMGYVQEKGVDFNEVFAPTTRFETLCLIMSLLGCEGWGGYEIYFVAAFLNGGLDQPVYMSQPPGYKDPEYPDHVCEVTNAL